jgi:hypothetical protein
MGGKTGGFGEAPLPLLAARKLVYVRESGSWVVKIVGEVPLGV